MADFNKEITVLFIDDEENIRALVSYNLRLEGFQIFLAHDGLSGLKIAKRIYPDLILLDVAMPGVDGLQVLSELKKNSRTKPIPVFMLTAKGMIDDIERAFDLGADDYITKPFDPHKLGKSIKKKMDRFQKR